MQAKALIKQSFQFHLSFTEHHLLDDEDSLMHSDVSVSMPQISALLPCEPFHPSLSDVPVFYVLSPSHAS